ncbi:MAG: N,N-dimethylformamidase beta subunit family domain-containing protein, partial [Gaiellaceae bacterium]
MTSWLGSRRRLLGFAAGSLFAGLTPRALARSGPLLSRLRVGNGGPPFEGDTPLLTTLTAAEDRRIARLEFHLARRATVSFDVEETGQGVASERPVTSGETGLSHREMSLEAGVHSVGWGPPPSLAPRTYVLRLTAADRSRRNAPAATSSLHAVARVLGIDAAFTARSARSGDAVSLTIRADASSLSLQMIRCGPEQQPTYANNELKGIPVGGPHHHGWSGHRDGAAGVYVELGGDWPSGIYAARIDSNDGRTGFAPLVLRPRSPLQRVAVVVPTGTWQAYNFYDANGDGWGDTWYARWKTTEIDLSRPHADRGVPYRFRSYELSFYHWLAGHGIAVDYYSDEDVEQFADPTALRAAYDLLVFPGHTEYVTTRLYDMVQGYRDLGGNLLFLSANNFFRWVHRAGARLH